MKSLRQGLAVVALVFFALSLAPSAGNAAEDKNAGLFINLHTFSGGSAGHAFVFAKKAMEGGHPVAIFLNHKAVLIAAEGVPQTSYQGQTLTKHLTDLIAKGAKVIVCQMCMAGHGMNEAQLVDGAVRGTPEMLYSYLFDPTYKVISW